MLSTGETISYRNRMTKAGLGPHVWLVGVITAVLDDDFIMIDGKPVTTEELEMKPMRVIGTCVKTGKHVIYSSLNAVNSDHLDPKLVKACCNGRRKNYAGYSWVWEAHV